jgi:hypothetical protein
MKKRLKIIITLIAFFILISGLVYNYVFNAEHRDITKEEAAISLSANELYLNFETDEASATVNYLDKVIETKGEISSVEDNDIVLNNRIQVSFNSQNTSLLKKGQLITIKGRCLGYDELLEVVKMDQATIIK